MVRRSLLGVLACCAAVLLTAGPARAALPVVDDDPAVAARGAGDMRTVIRGSDGALWTRSWDGSSWTGWTSLGGSITSGPSISARPDGVYDVVARGTDGATHHKAFTPSGVKARNNRLKPRVIKVVFFIDRGKRRRTDRHKPYKTRMQVSFKRGSKHRVHARVYFRRKGQSRVQRKTVSKRFVMCR